MVVDLFISHASEDKEEVARPLANKFIKLGLSVWYDEYTLTVGDSLRRSIDQGLAECRFGLVILSPHFLQKEWTQKELDGLVAREDRTQKRVLPVWHKVKRSDVVTFSPTLADKLGVSTAKGLDHVVNEIMRVFQISNLETITGVAAPQKKQRSQKRRKRVQSDSMLKSVTWVMVDRFFFPASRVQQGQDRVFTVKIAPTTVEQEADLETLRPQWHAASVPFAVRYDAHLVRVRGCEKDLSSKRALWTLTLAPEEGNSFGSAMEPTFNDGSKVYTPEDVARLRAGRLLMNEPPPKSSDNRSFGAYSFLEGAIAGSGKYLVRECAIQSMFTQYGKSSSWREFARLQAIFLLKATGAVDDILALTIGPVRAGKVAVTFRGRRRARYSGNDPVQIEVSGACPVQ
jgi:hypothetical protein